MVALSPERFAWRSWAAREMTAAPAGEMRDLVGPASSDSAASASVRSRHVNLALAPKAWTAVYAASCICGGAVAVEHWKGEVA